MAKTTHQLLSLTFAIGVMSLLGTSSSARAEPIVEQLDTASLALSPFAVESFYRDRPGQKIWDNPVNFDSLLVALGKLAAHGLNPADYHIKELEQTLPDDDARDFLATDAWLTAAAHMLYGKLDPVSVEPSWTAGRRQADLAGSLSEALETQAIASSLEQFAPKQKGYTVLKAHYQELTEQISAEKTLVPGGATLKPGMRGSAILALQQRLGELGYLQTDQFSTIMDEQTSLAAKLFQQDAGLEADGLVGPATRTALNRGPQEKLNQLRVNMERWRWLPDDLGRRHLRANIAGFDVTAWENGKPVRSYLTIVGKTYRKTPVFSDEIEYAIFNPWWETPYSIARADKLTLFRQEPSAVQDLGFQVRDRDGIIVDPATIDWQTVSSNNFPYRLRQAPGEQNALGQVKIMFPNSHNVYLHDTPGRGLFGERQRAFSSGCLRTQYPLDLAAWLLNDKPGWDREKIEQVVGSGKETRVNLTNKVPVHILYFTAIDEGDRVRYLDDLYLRDHAVLAGLQTAHE